ncbi:MAG: hypothetical protein ACYDDF_09755 [Thermoplasmatota archaeon]
MRTLEIGIALLVVGLIIGVLPLLGVLAGSIFYIGWLLVLVGLGMAIYHMLMNRPSPTGPRGKKGSPKDSGRAH